MRARTGLAAFAVVWLVACGEDEMAQHTFILDHVEFEEIWPGCHVQQNRILGDPEQTIANLTWTTVEFETVKHDNGGGWSTVTNEYTVPRGGIYSLKSQVILEIIDADKKISGKIEVDDGTGYAAVANAYRFTHGDSDVMVDIIHPAQILLAWHKVRISIFQDSGGGANVSSDGANTFLAIQMVQ